MLRLLLEVEKREELERIATKESIKRLCELAIGATKPKEFTLVFDDLTDITKYGVSILEKLKNPYFIEEVFQKSLPLLQPLSQIFRILAGTKTTLPTSKTNRAA